MKKIFYFLHQAEKLKDTLRYNQTSSGRKESSAEHSWRLSLMVFTVASELKLEIDVFRALKIAIVHDIAESITGDIDAVRVHKGEISKEEKFKLEILAMQRIKEMLSAETGKEIASLWEEYEKNETSEAKYVKALDKIETLTQLVEAGYKTYDYPEMIANYADKAVKNFPPLLPMLKILKGKLKMEFEKGGLEWKSEYDSITS
jgi:putative hydrolase of HD superfamily